MGKRQGAASLSAGDIFTIPLGGGRARVGQVISSFHAAHSIVVRDFAAPESELPAQRGSRNHTVLSPVLAGLTCDAPIGRGHW